jgi:hypothetical protein
MKNIKILVIFFCLTNGYSQNVSNKNVRIPDNLKEKTQYNHPYGNKSPKPEGYKNAAFTYDKDGNIIEIIQYNSSGKMISKENYSYNSNGDVTSFRRYDGKRDKVIYKKNYKYNNKGQKIEETGFDGSGQFSADFTYDSKDRLIGIKYYTGPKLTEKRVFTYSGNKRTIKVYTAEGALKSTIIHTLNNEGQITEEIKYDNNQNELYKNIYAYNETGKAVKEKRYERGNFVYEITNVYKPSGDLLKVLQKNEDGEEFEKTRYEYNILGLLDRKLYRSKPSQDFSWKKYTYNERGLCKAIETYYASYNYHTLFKYAYEFYGN